MVSRTALRPGLETQMVTLWSRGHEAWGESRAARGQKSLDTILVIDCSVINPDYGGILLIFFEDFGTLACEYFLPNHTLEVAHHRILFSDRKNQQAFCELGFCFMQRLFWTSAVFLPEITVFMNCTLRDVLTLNSKCVLTLHWMTVQ